MMNHEDFDAIKKLTDAMALTRAEIDGTRAVLIAALATLSKDRDLSKAFTNALHAAREAELAYCLSSPMSDDEMQQRLDWIDRLTPHALRQQAN
jgi:secreted Zn-dependent insulinase-like peptidase